VSLYYPSRSTFTLDNLFFGYVTTCRWVRLLRTPEAEALLSFEKQVNANPTTQRHIPGNLNPSQNCRGNLQLRNFNLLNLN